MRGENERFEKSKNYALQLLTSQEEMREIWLYGSYARGIYRYGSDIDLYAVTNVTLSASRAAEIRNLSCPDDYTLPEVDVHFGSLSPLDKDFHDKIERCNKIYMQNIKKEGVLLWRA